MRGTDRASGIAARGYEKPWQELYLHFEGGGSPDLIKHYGELIKLYKGTEKEFENGSEYATIQATYT